MNEFLNNLSNSLEFLKWGLLFLMTLVVWKHFRLPSLKWIWIIWAIFLIAKPLGWITPLVSMDLVDYGGEPISQEVFQKPSYAIYSKAMRLSYLLTPIIELLVVVLILADFSGLLERLDKSTGDNAFSKFLAWARSKMTPIGIVAVVLTLLSNGLTLFLPIWASILFSP